ncbi:MAG: sugar transferase [Pseudomonadota bacterium]
MNNAMIASVDLYNSSEFDPPERRKHLKDRVIFALSRMRYQYSGGFIVASVIPACVATAMNGSFLPSSLVVNSFIVSLLAFSLGFLFFRKLTVYPGIRAISYIVPSFLAAFGSAGTLFWLLQLPFDFEQIVGGLIAVIAWFLIIFLLSRRGKRLELNIVPGGVVNRISEFSFVQTRELKTPNDIMCRGPIVADFRANLSSEWEKFVADAALGGRQVYHVKQLEESLSGRVRIEHLSENPFGSLSPSIMYVHAKRALDCVLAIVALIILFLPLIFISIAIRVDSPGPSIFRQQRIGLGGRTFTMLKFRSMRELTDAERTDPEAQTRHDELRVTRIGKFIRRTRLDELPQILNILKGEMTWIGPRPESIALSTLYEAQVPFYRYRHVVRPGITGWAQVNQGHVIGIEDAIEKLEYDFFYVKHFSLWLDILVSLRTVRVVLTGLGAR